MERLIQGVWPLPGGQGRYLQTLLEFLTWVQPNSGTTRRKAISWFGERFESQRSAPGYLGVMQGLGVISMERGKEAIQLTDFGLGVWSSGIESAARLVAQRFLTGYTGFKEILHYLSEQREYRSLREIYEGIGHLFPTWTTPTQVEYRLEWLFSLGLIHRRRGRIFLIGDLGKEYLQDGQTTVSIRSPDLPISALEPRTPLNRFEELLLELDEASVDSARPDRFEAALARAFEELGYAVTELGGAGDTDILVTANLGPQSYSLIVDAKARRAGKVEQLEVLTLVDHRKGNGADHAVVVAREFGSGKVTNHALEHGVILLPLRVLKKWLEGHHRWPQSLLAYRSVFSNGGLLPQLPADLAKNVEEGSRWSRLITEIVAVLSEGYGYGVADPMPARQVFQLLVYRQKGITYSESEVTSALEFLSHPAVGALVSVAAGYLLVMPHQNLALRLTRLAEQIEVSIDESPAAEVMEVVLDMFRG